MKITKLKLKNFAQFTDFECEFGGNVTRLVGMNGDGKTTVGLTAIWACLKGISEKTKGGQLVGERFRFIGNEKATADITLTLVDELKGIEVEVNNHISKTGNKITFKAIKGTLDDNWMNDFLSVAFLSAKNFTQISSKDQAIALGIDTSDFDDKLSLLKSEFTLINRDIKNIGAIERAELVVKVSVSDLTARLKEYQSFNNDQERIAKEAGELKGHIIEQRSILEELQESIKLTEEDIADSTEVYKKLPKPAKDKNVDSVVTALNEADSTNRLADEYERSLVKLKQKTELEGKLADNKELQKQVGNNKIEYIKSFDFGFDGLTVDDAGGLMLNERPIREPYFSKGEFEIIVAKLHASQNPELKVRFIDDFELLDADNQAEIVDSLLESGFQIITAEVGNVKNKDNTILLRECKNITNEQSSNGLL